jgi:hypothetical protein
LDRDRVSESYLRDLAEVPLLHQSGDGIRSFAGTLVAATCGAHPLLLIDEPEAFLHPPQARRLSRAIARSTAESFCPQGGKRACAAVSEHKASAACRSRERWSAVPGHPPTLDLARANAEYPAPETSRHSVFALESAALLSSSSDLNVRVKVRLD